ncbi:MAG: bifunctional precorrin-2 dehydrogenase/sirohydrochlorin ferrochelatase [Armatimonadetes bacterium]|nr:bifunctional precorrin-2 dehydrogenase/sirohydrochlorin ferrochelatase [Armatimonadota bacterium]
MLLPVALNLENRAVLIIGGGAVAARKAAAFLECGARVVVVSPDLSDDFPAAEYRAKRYQSADLEGFFLVCAGTDSREVNARIACDAKAKGIWCNLADDPENSDFHTVSTIRRGEIAIGVSTSGLSPVLARFVRRKIEESLPLELDMLIEMTSSYPISTEIRGEFWRHLLESEILDLLRQNQTEAAQSQLDALFSQLNSRP